MVAIRFRDGSTVKVSKDGFQIFTDEHDAKQHSFALSLERHVMKVTMDLSNKREVPGQFAPTI